MVAPLLAFAGVSAVVIVTPGPDTVVTIGGTLSGGRRGGMLTAFGICCGQAVWALAASAGISALLVASASAFMAVKYAGAGYLAFLGIQALWSAITNGHKPADQAGTSRPPAQHDSGWSSFRRGLLSDLGNPKIAVFFTGLLPQFGSGFAALELLGLLFSIMTFAWLCCYSLAVARMGDLIRRSRIRRIRDAVTGTVLVAFGLRLAFERR